MNVNNFYQTQTDNAIPLYFISQKEWIEESPTLHCDYLNNQRFSAKQSEIVVIKDDLGFTQCVYCGVGENNYETAIANAALNLMPGTYIPQQSLSINILNQWALAQYRFQAFKQQNNEARVLVVSEKELTTILIETKAVFLVRDLINSPANVMTPNNLSQIVAEQATLFQGEFNEWEGKELIEFNFPAIYNVGKASENSPRLIHLTWGDKNHPKIALIGKGVCFDSGGLNIKPASGMRIMKKDMGGAAHVIGLAEWIMAKKLPVHLTVLIPAVENSIASNAFRPGDIFFMRNGLSVEVDNTDAEGRLILADALTKASEDKPDLIIDFATLTGAARVALGPDIAVMFSNNEQVANELLQISEEINDPMWRLPLYAGYESMLDSSVANLVNSSLSAYGGAITAALFLNHFVPANIPWVHFDIMAWNLVSRPGKPEGGEALAMRTIAQYLEKKYY